MSKAEAKNGRASKVWVLVVLLVGLFAGIFLSAAPLPTPVPSPGRGPGWGLRLETAEDFDVILSTVGVALLVALLVVYGKIYGETKASFALGLLVVLAALLLQSILSSPLVFGAFGVPSADLGTFLAFADAFKVFAFTVFLYLSLG